MTEPTWDLLCVLCIKRGYEKRLDSGHVCLDCAVALQRSLIQIGDLVLSAAAWIAPGSSTGAGGAKSFESKPPLNVDAVDPANVGVPAFDGEPEPHQTLLEILEGFERMVREERQMAPYGPVSHARASTGQATVVGVLDFLKRSVPWMVNEPEFPIDDFHEMVRRCLRAVKRWDQDRENAHHGLRCPTLYDDGPCGYFMRWESGATGVDCPRCHREWTIGWLLLVGADQDNWLDAESLSVATRVHEQTIRKWARTGKVAKRGLLYSVRDVAKQVGVAAGSSAGVGCA